MLLPMEFPVGLWPSMFAVQGGGGRSERHKHHAMHLILARSGLLSATVADDQRSNAGVLVPSDVEHAVDSTGTVTLMLFVDREAESAARLGAAETETARWFSTQERDALLGDLVAHPNGAQLTDWMHTALTALGSASEAARVQHPKVRQALRMLAGESLAPAPALEDIATRVGLSPSRFVHVFTESVGTTWRAYLRWLRFQRAASVVVAGATLTQAAMKGGFYDSAHMTRVFKELYGVTPSQLRPLEGPRATGATRQV